jgi:SAM-dependent methyltransferase
MKLLNLKDAAGAEPRAQADLLDSIRAIRERHAQAEINWNVHPSDGGMEDPSPAAVEHYVRDSRSALDLILKAMLQTGKADVSTILDFPCGYGRVIRHLRAAFPEASITACDIDIDGVHFCVQQFGTEAIASTPDFRGLNLNKTFDLIWCGSLFSHLPRHKFIDCLDLLSRSLAPDGIALFTSHGRFSAIRQRGVYLPTEAFDPMLGQYHASGFGYADYEHSFSPNEYGVTLSSFSFIAEALANDTSIRIVSMTERAWSDHQDAVVIQKRPVLT